MATANDVLPPGAVHVKYTEKKEGGKKEEGPGVILLRDALWMKTTSRKLSIAFKDIQDLQVNATSAGASKIARYMMRFRVRQTPMVMYILEFTTNDDLQRIKEQLSHAISTTMPPPPASHHPSLRGEGTSDAEQKQRQQLLQKHPNTLKRQYNDMVVGTYNLLSDLISEHDFWNLPCRKQLLLTERAKRQKTGKTSEILSDVQGENQSGGKSVKYNLNPEIIHQIFVQYPVVYLAYQEQVPDKMTGLEFWGLFVKSKYAHRDKTSGLSTQQNQHLGHPEDLFTRYEEKYQAKLQQVGPKDLQHVDPLINLVASYSNDSVQSTTDTNLAKFNRHAADVLHVKGAAAAALDSIVLAVELDDLAPPQPEPVLPLSLENAARNFKTQLTNHFHDVSELLRHYLSFKAKAMHEGTAEARTKLAKIKAKMGEKFEYLEHIRNKLPPAEKTTLAPLLTPFLDQLNIPFLDDDSKAF
ncbi:hypothetical protein DYB38_003526 [Aphanomyces astaci]|uniref:BSD domain-containing protein n=1 Tax=Aphanomyces astaci TaxID=112090 RepID=A0A397CJF9_APHAT|nr:hypothetical protein DYB38_003526 [Aphanomyces astaci]